ncbi:MAG: hypothetical protein HY719_14060 [Planctomycetes bacterium]|nr:hypothetical protein [Planctomycetota bacterium]
MNPEHRALVERHLVGPRSRVIRPAGVHRGKSRGRTSNPQYAIVDDASYCRLRGEEGIRARLVVDFGFPLRGRWRVQVLRSSGTPLSVSAAEALRFLDAPPGAANGGEAPGGAPGAQVFTPPKEEAALIQARETSTFRYLAISTGGEGWADIRMVDAQVEGEIMTPADFSGAFFCDDEELTRAWYAGAYTAALCLRDVPGGVTGRSVLSATSRGDRPPRAAEALAAMETLFAVSARRDVVRDLLVSLEETLRERGDRPGAGGGSGAGAPHGEDDEDSLWWVVAAANYCHETGDAAFLDRALPAAEELTHRCMARVGPGGLYVAGAPWRRAWSPGRRRVGAVTFANALLIWALRSLASMCLWAWQEERWASIRAVARNLARAVNERLWDDDAGAYVESDADRARHPLDANIFCPMLDVSLPLHAERALSYVRRTMRTSYGTLSEDGDDAGAEAGAGRVWPFLNSFEAMARFRAGASEEAFDVIGCCWRNMLRRDPQFTFWEWVGPDGGPEDASTACAGAAAAGVTMLLSDEVLGVTPLAPAYEEVLVRPRPGWLARCEGTRGTVRGPVEVHFEADEEGGASVVRVRAPRGVKCSVDPTGILEGREAEVALFVVGDDGERVALHTHEIRAGGAKLIPIEAGPEARLEIRYRDE